ncbi:MAG: hypothetical protein B7Z08_06615 [Sphingomonadales bacterium 32-68-7]|nr:MAG: hypothetical protein B7Z33_05900 [Sphingomonadales bacterium 12-68-11]OYX09118.1 MAG: hypothetical protein B7Z08_06615 [Sphingomonadales bacterium 32-68-7]
MASLTLPPARTARRLPIALAGAALLLALAGAVLWAQVSGERGIAPVATSTDIEVSGIAVNVTGDTAEEARQNGWDEAAGLAWKQIGGPDLPAGRINALVSAIVIEREQLGPRRYIATLGVIFDRARAGGLLGQGGERARSAPMLTLPVLISGGTQTMFEVRNPWQRAWAEFQAGASAIDYVRPMGAGGESLLLTYGQTGRRSRAWWGDVLGQFGAADVLVPIANLRWEWPGGPVVGEFTARYGPDSRYLGRFTMRAESPEQLPAMLARAVRQFDALFARALAEGKLTPDPSLSLDTIQLAPEIRALIDAARVAAEAEAAGIPVDGVLPPTIGEGPLDPSVPPAQGEPAAAATFTVQVATPDAASIDAALASVRSAPGVRGVAASSIAIGGTSVLRVTYGGEIGDLAQALRGRGWSVSQGSNALGISR